MTTRPLCSIEPDLWHQDSGEFRQGRNSGDAITKSLTALRYCAQCPLSSRNNPEKPCLIGAFSDKDRLDYGISDGTLPFERREILGLSTASDQSKLQRKIREAANKEGLPVPDLTEVAQWAIENTFFKRSLVSA